jgi:hypothetical protein
MEVVVWIILLQISQILLPLQILLILLILSVPIWTIVVGAKRLRSYVAAAQDEQAQQCNCQEKIFHRIALPSQLDVLS